MDLRKYIQRNGEWDWIEQEQTRLGGEDAFYKMRGAMWLMLSKIPENKFFDIEKGVREENRELFIKIASEWMLTPQGEYYIFNKLMNKISHMKHVKFVRIVEENKNS